MMSLRLKPAWFSIAAVFTLLCVSFPVSGEHIESETLDFRVEVNQDHGVTFIETVNFSGTSTQPLRNTTWTVVNISGPTPITVISGPYLTSVSPIAEGQYAWSLVVEVGAIDCTCYLELRSEDAQHNIQSTSLVFYLGMGHHRPVLVDSLPSIAQSAPSFLAPTVLRDAVDVPLELVLPMNQTGHVQVFADMCEAPFDVCLVSPTSVVLPSTFDEQGLVVRLNTTSLDIEEGIWQFDIRVEDELLRTSASVRLVVVHDQTPPTAQLTLPNVVTEGTPFHVFADVDDGYEGSTSTLTWALTLVDGSVRAPLANEVVSAQQLNLNLSDSGRYTLALTALDATGLMTKTEQVFVVENIKPVASIAVDGLKITSGSSIKLGHEGNWSLDAQDSLDNEEVEYLWVINDVISIRGVPALVLDDFPSAGTHTVELIVFDDDGATDTWMIEVEILEPPSSEQSSSVIGMIGVGLLGLLLVLVFIILRPSTPQVSDLPKWEHRAVKNGGKNGDFVDDLDATIEEDKARG
jgi:hypothetical protein